MLSAYGHDPEHTEPGATEVVDQAKGLNEGQDKLNEERDTEVHFEILEQQLRNCFGDDILQLIAIDIVVHAAIAVENTVCFQQSESGGAHAVAQEDEYHCFEGYGSGGKEEEAEGQDDGADPEQRLVYFGKTLGTVTRRLRFYLQHLWISLYV